MANETKTLDADGSVEFDVNDGGRYGYTVSGTFGSGTVTVSNEDIDLATHTEDGGNEVFATDNKLTFTLAGSTSPDLTIRVTGEE